MQDTETPLICIAGTELDIGNRTALAAGLVEQHCGEGDWQ